MLKLIGALLLAGELSFLYFLGFLFAADADGLVRPLNILFRDAANVEWIQ